MDTAVLKGQIKDAKEAHESWKVKLRSAIDSGVLPKPARDITMDDQCSFGKWLKSLANDPGVQGNLKYNAVVRAHAAFHRQAGNVASYVERDNQTMARDALTGGAFQEATSRLNAAMDDWLRSI